MVATLVGSGVGHVEALPSGLVTMMLPPSMSTGMVGPSTSFMPIIPDAPSAPFPIMLPSGSLAFDLSSPPHAPTSTAASAKNDVAVMSLVTT